MTAVRALTDKEYEVELREIFENVFVVTEPYGEVFTSSIGVRGLLYPVAFELERTEFQALATAARVVGDDTLCLSLLTQDRDPRVVNHWLIPLDDLSNYYSLSSYNTVLPNVLYSRTGKWGIRVTDASYALAGGSDAFIETLFSHMPNSAEKQLYDCIAAYRSELAANRFGGPPLRAFLLHLYGEEKTQEILADAGIPSSFGEDP